MQIAEMTGSNMPSIDPSQLPLMGSNVDFRSVSAAEEQIMMIHLNYDLRPMLAASQQQIQQALTDNGCSKQNVHSFRHEISPNALTVLFHVKYVKRSCWNFFGDQNTDLATIESNAWARVAFQNNGVESKHLSILPTAGGDDNVPQLARDALKILANILSIVPGFNVIGIHLDAAIFEMLKAERDFLDGSLMSPYLQQSPLMQGYDIGDQKDKNKSKVPLDMVFLEEIFSEPNGIPTLTIVVANSQQHPLAKSQACEIAAMLTEQQQQLSQVGVNGTEHTVAAGESLWSVSKTFYGNSAYRWLIVDANNLGVEAPLQIGQSISLPPPGKYLHGKSRYVTHSGENLWSITGASENRENYKTALKKNNKILENPNLIYPGEIIR